MKKPLLTMGAALFACSFSAQAAVLIQHDFDTDASLTTPDVIAANISSTAPMSPTGGFTNLTALPADETSLFTSEGNGLGNGVQTNVSGAFTNNEFWEFSITADAGFTLDLDNLTFDISRGANGALDYIIRTSADNFASDFVFASGGIGTAPAAQDIDLTSTEFQGLEEITFQIAYDRRASNAIGDSAVRLDNLVVNGDVVTAVPEPSSTVLLGLGGLALLARRRR